MCVSPVCVPVHRVCACRLQTSEQGFKSPEAGVVAGCELQQVLLTAELTLQSQWQILDSTSFSVSRAFMQARSTQTLCNLMPDPLSSPQREGDPWLRPGHLFLSTLFPWLTTIYLSS